MEKIIVLFLIFLIVLCQVLLLVYYLRSRKQTQVKPDDDWDLVHDAIKKSQAIIGNAELESVKISAQASQQASRLEKEYENEMKLSVDEVLESIKAETAKAGMEYKQNLQKQSEDIKNLSSEETRKILVEFRGQLDRNLHEIQDGFAKELASYKTQKEKEIDNKAEEIIERAVEIYLGKKLDKREHMQLVFEALDRAKVEKVL